MTAWEIAAWAAAALFAVWALVGLAMLPVILAARHDARAEPEPEPPRWQNQGRLLDDLQVDHWCRQLAEATDGDIWQELAP